MEKLDHSYIVGGKVKWYRYYGERVWKLLKDKTKQKINK